MPLVKIDIIKGERSPDEIKRLADVVQEVLIDKFAAPTRDRYQVTKTIFLETILSDKFRLLHNMSHMR